jgi:hypothetical protein
MIKKLLIASAALGALAFPSGAGAFVNSQGAEKCPGQVFEQSFLQFGDKRHYTLVPNGNFEDGLNGWDVSGDVELIDLPNPFRPDPGSTALVMKPGSSVTSAPICASRGYPVARAFQRKLANGKGGHSLKVEVLWPPRERGGQRTAKPAGRLSGSATYAPTRKFAIGQGRARRGTANIRFRFTVIGDATYLLDDLLLDPRCRR